MRTRSLGLTLFAGLSIFVAACSSGGASPSAAAPSTAASAAASVAAPSAAASGSASAGASAGASASAAASGSAGASASAAAHSDLKIGVVTDIGTLDDKNYNEYTYKGVQAGAAAIGAANPPAVVPKDASEYALEDPGVRRPGLQHDRHGRLQPRRRHRRGRGQEPEDHVHRRRPVADLHRQDRQAGLHVPLPARLDRRRSELHLDRLPGGSGRLPRRDHRRVGEQERHDRRHRRHLAVRSVHPLYPGLRARREVGQDGHQGQDRVRDQRLLERRVQRPGRWQEVRRRRSSPRTRLDVLFQVAGKTGNGILDSACDAGIYGVGVDVDQALSYPNAAKCTVTSAEKHLQIATGIGDPAARRRSEDQRRPSCSTRRPRASASRRATTSRALITPDIQKKVDDAMAAMVAGTLKTCTDKCGALPVQ